eukprot:7166993-Heterocapsa_arctica.AAC.1
MPLFMQSFMVGGTMRSRQLRLRRASGLLAVCNATLHELWLAGRCGPANYGFAGHSAYWSCIVA